MIVISFYSPEGYDTWFVTPADRQHIHQIGEQIEAMYEGWT